MRKYTIENQITGIREEFFSYALADQKIKDLRTHLMTEYLVRLQHTLKISILEGDQYGNWKQSLSDANGEPMHVVKGWFYLPINQGVWKTAAVTTNGGVTHLGTPEVFQAGSDYWIDNGPTYASGIQGLASQIYNASGKILLAGLGLGLLALILDNKPEVTSITVVEKNKDVIDAFLSNHWKTDKINIVNADILEYNGEGFDWALLDHYNQTRDIELYNIYLQHLKIINQNIIYQNLDLFAWEEAYHFWLQQEYKEHSLSSYLEFAKTLGLPEYHVDTLNYYYSQYLDNAKNIDINISAILQQIYETKNLINKTYGN